MKMWYLAVVVMLTFLTGCPHVDSLRACYEKGGIPFVDKDGVMISCKVPVQWEVVKP